MPPTLPTRSTAPETTGPRLVPRRRARHTALALWHLLSLDAPTVAALWTWFLARSVGLKLPWTSPAAMFIAVWMIYAADRLLDARSLDESAPRPGERGPGASALDRPAYAELEARHRFHHRHRKGFLAGMVCAALALASLLPSLNPRSLALYALLAALLGAWMVLIHALPRPGGGVRRLPKELAVGAFFPAACFIPTVARLPSLQLRLLPAAGLFAAVCSLNCLFLYAWEHPAAAHRRSEAAHWSTVWAVGHLRHLSVALLWLGVAVAGFDEALAAPAFACAASAVLLATLHRFRGRVGAIHLRAAADLALLSPLFWLGWWLLKP